MKTELEKAKELRSKRWDQFDAARERDTAAQRNIYGTTVKARNAEYAWIKAVGVVEYLEKREAKKDGTFHFARHFLLTRARSTSDSRC